MEAAAHEQAHQAQVALTGPVADRRQRGQHPVTSCHADVQKLTPRQVLDCGEHFQSFNAVPDNLAYVMDAGNMPLFSSAPGQVAFAPGSRAPAVTAESTVNACRVRAGGRLRVVQQPLPTARAPCAGWSVPVTSPTAATPGTSPSPATRTDTRGRLALTNDVGTVTPPSAKSQGFIDQVARFAESAVEGTVAV
ncbi:hypothetical protein AB0C70_38015 [Streptomyces sp. NPDC048564]|uniref:hypothetical protein n=1 Tax=Streptomyces sp. NPDC048564 TaxID=3155760 RepID=UPI0034130AC1